MGGSVGRWEGRWQDKTSQDAPRKLDRARGTWFALHPRRCCVCRARQGVSPPCNSEEPLQCWESSVGLPAQGGLAPQWAQSPLDMVVLASAASAASAAYLPAAARLAAGREWERGRPQRSEDGPLHFSAVERQFESGFGCGSPEMCFSAAASRGTPPQPARKVMCSRSAMGRRGPRAGSGHKHPRVLPSYPGGRVPQRNRRRCPDTQVQAHRATAGAAAAAVAARRPWMSMDPVLSDQPGCDQTLKRAWEAPWVVNKVVRRRRPWVAKFARARRWMVAEATGHNRPWAKIA
mmetsp:Transcript_65381/g.165657  ORF Transcript_65381/g.165657 Transcript_65381/m.165657 type:complete len:291 (-) Transcript_65381:7-879(-)